MKRIVYVCIISIVLFLLSGCSEKKEISKNTFIGVWITWADTQTFVADEYIKTSYLNNATSEFNYSPVDNGLYIFNYITYDDDTISDRVTIASKELEVEDTIYEEDTIYNKVSLHCGYTLPENILFYNIYEKDNGEIYVDTLSESKYYRHFGVEQIKKINKSGYHLDIEFFSVDIINQVEVTEYNLAGEKLKEYSFDYSNVENKYKILNEASYVVIEAKYTDNKDKEYIENEYLVFNEAVKKNTYSCCMVEDGVGRYEEIIFEK